MRARTWAIFIAVNVLVSAAIVLAFLLLWERPRTPAPATLAPASTAIPALLATEEAPSSPTAPPIASPTPLPPPVYVVQEGDTLGAIAQVHDVSIEDLMAANGLADPNMLHPGQTLIIPVTPFPAPTTEPYATTLPEPPPVAAPLPTPLPTITPASPPLVEIAQALGSGNLANEVVIVRNRGGVASLEGWTLSDAEGHTFTFPALTLFTDAQVRLHTAAGVSTPTDLYWGRDTPAWKGGILVTLRDTAGNVVDTYIVP